MLTAMAPPPGTLPPGLLASLALRPVAPPNTATVTTTPPTQPAPNHHGGDEIKIPAKLCFCQQNCTERVTPDLIRRVCLYFKCIPERSLQYKYLASLIQFKTKPTIEEPKISPTGRRYRQAGFRYYVPVISEEELKIQRKMNTDFKAQWFLGMDPKGTLRIFQQVVDPTWDHVEVCLRAFVTIHIMSEKRVIITRQTKKLQKYVKCSKPFPSHANLAVMEHNSRRRYDRDDEAIRNDFEDEYNIENVLRDVRIWMAEQAKQAQKDAYRMLPVGLVLPASITCMPVCPKEPSIKPYLPQDQDRDVDIVSNFFSHQLWKPEYIGGVP